jgi:hypothetical protein
MTYLSYVSRTFFVVQCFTNKIQWDGKPIATMAMQTLMSSLRGCSILCAQRCQAGKHPVMAGLRTPSYILPVSLATLMHSTTRSSNLRSNVAGVAMLAKLWETMSDICRFQSKCLICRPVTCNYSLRRIWRKLSKATDARTRSASTFPTTIVYRKLHMRRTCFSFSSRGSTIVDKRILPGSNMGHDWTFPPILPIQVWGH